MQNIRSYKELRVYQTAIDAAMQIFELTKHFPADERFGLTAQLRRAAISIPSNIGEGQRRKRRKAFLNRLDIALGSQGEVDVQNELALRLKFFSAKEHARYKPVSTASGGCSMA